MNQKVLAEELCHQALLCSFSQSTIGILVSSEKLMHGLCRLAGPLAGIWVRMML